MLPSVPMHGVRKRVQLAMSDAMSDLPATRAATQPIMFTSWDLLHNTQKAPSTHGHE